MSATSAIAAGGSADAFAAAESLEWRLLDFYGGLRDLRSQVLRSPYPPGRPLPDVWAEVLRTPEERAKLVEKQSVTSKITAAQLEVADARDRVARMQSSVAALAAKAGEVEAMIGRSVEASSELRSEIAIEDPLEAKFRDL